MSFTNAIEKAVVEGLTLDKDQIKLDKALLPILVTIVNDTKSIAFAFQLRANGVITRNEEEECDGFRTSFQKNNYLYNIVIKKPGSGKLIKALLETDNEHIVKLVAESFWKLNPDKFPVTDSSTSSTAEASSSSSNPPPATTQIGGQQKEPEPEPSLLPAPSSPNGKKLLEKLSGIRFKNFLPKVQKDIFEDTIPSDFIVKLHANNVINVSQSTECEALRTDNEKNKYLYSIIAKKNAVRLCIVALEDSDNPHIIETMLNEL